MNLDPTILHLLDKEKRQELFLETEKERLIAEAKCSSAPKEKRVTYPLHTKVFDRLLQNIHQAIHVVEAKRLPVDVRQR